MPVPYPARVLPFPLPWKSGAKHSAEPPSCIVFFYLPTMNTPYQHIWLEFPDNKRIPEPHRLDYPARPCHWFELDINQKPNFSEWTGMRRYAPLIPFAKSESWMGLGEPCTPVETAQFAGQSIQLKMEYLMPTGSYKDRGTVAMMQHVQQVGPERIVQDSSGNAGISVAAYAARLGIECRIYVPAGLPASKLKQLNSYGAQVRLVEGNREQVTQALLNELDGAYLGSHVWNPLFLHGTKTFLWELLEQVNQGAARWPEEIIFPVGNGTLLLGCFLALREMSSAHCLPAPIRLSAAQTTACAPLLAGTSVDPKPSMAAGIAIGNPPRLTQMLHAIQETQGRILAVSEQEIQNAAQQLSQQGWYTEYTSAVGLAAWTSAGMPPNVLIPLTGSGLKNP